MADSKITALAALTAADPVNDMFPVVDVSDTSMAASGTTKRISANNILSSSPTASGALTVTGLVTAGSASITGAATVGTTLGVTGDLTVDTSTLVVDSTNNRVGIGLASGMTAPLEVQSNTSGTSINVRGRSDNSGAMRFFANDGTTQQAYISADNTNIDILSVSTRPIRLSVNATVVASALNGGNVSIANGNLVMSTSGKGIDFSATSEGSGTMTSELLNDYEEGTWTAAVAGTTDPGSATYPARTGQYTKIGRTVFLNLYLEWSDHTGTGNMSITGLPFTSSSAASAYSAGSIGFFENISLTAANIPFIYIGGNSAFITLRQMASGGGANNVIPMDAAGGMIINISYNV